MIAVGMCVAFSKNRSVNKRKKMLKVGMKIEETPGFFIQIKKGVLRQKAYALISRLLQIYPEPAQMILCTG